MQKPAPTGATLSPAPAATIAPALKRQPQDIRRLRLFGIAVLVLLAAHFVPLVQWTKLALKADLYSHMLMIPFVCGYLAWQDKDKLRNFTSSPSLGALFAVVGIGLACLWFFPQISQLPPTTRIAISIAGLVCLVWALFAAILGKDAMKSIAFPIGFLIFMAPMPMALEHAFEAFLQHRSADTAYALIKLSGTPVLRDDTVLTMPGFALEVAPECSGIRSTVVLFLTSLVGGHLFLKRAVHKGILAASVIVLGILRNGFRILTLAWLCVHVDPEIIHSPLHHRGGPIFFGLSLIPLFILLWYFRKRENAKSAA